MYYTQSRNKNDADSDDEDNIKVVQTEYSPMWAPYRDARLHEIDIKQASNHKNIVSELKHILALATTSQLNGLLGEAYYEILCVLDGCEKENSDCYNPLSKVSKYYSQHSCL